MGYTLNFNLIWRHFDKLWGGLLLSLELAVGGHRHRDRRSGSPSPSLMSRGGRIVRTLIGAYVEFVRNVPLLLLVYLVFYGLPQAVGSELRRDDVGSSRRCRSIPAPTSSRCSGPGLEAVPCRPHRCRQGDRADAVAAPRPCAASDDAPHHAAGPIEHVRLPLQGHFGRVGHRRAGADLRRPVDQHEHVPDRRGLSGRHGRCTSSPATPSCSGCA